jgi:hypothetical protein
MISTKTCDITSYSVTGMAALSYLPVTGLQTTTAIPTDGKLLSLLGLKYRNTAAGAVTVSFMLQTDGVTGPYFNEYLADTRERNRTVYDVTSSLPIGSHNVQIFWKTDDPTKVVELLNGCLSTVLLEGAVGATGDQGWTGVMGIPGPTGAFGGPPGLTGLQGATGLLGGQGVTGPGVASFSKFVKILPMEEWKTTNLDQDIHGEVPVIEFDSADPVELMEMAFPVPLEWDTYSDMTLRVGSIIDLPAATGDKLTFKLSYKGFNKTANTTSFAPYFTQILTHTMSSPMQYDFHEFEFTLAGANLRGYDYMFLRLEKVTETPNLQRIGICSTQLEHGVSVGAGPTGYQGVTGIEGHTGAQGLSAIYKLNYAFESSTSQAAVGNTELGLDNTDPSQATAIWFSETITIDGQDQSVIDRFWEQLSAGDIVKIYDYDDATKHNYYIVTSVQKQLIGLVWQVVLGVSHITLFPFETSQANYSAGSGWIGISTEGLPGVTGLQGTTGFQGATGPLGGPVGPQGVTGFAGITGYQGFTGAQGLGVTGLIGVTGFCGATGSQGATGAQGLGVTGLIGVTGTVGMTGSQGLTGLEGYVGQTGLSGATGSEGHTGAQGLQGDSGVTGLGFTGLQGETGQIGETGVQGTQGPTGAYGGPAGETGLPGPTGIQGLTGALGAGYTGLPGVTGQMGITGAFGGPPGETGLQGLTGVDGATGIPGLTGQEGSTGLQGATGLLGATGLQGFTGIQGETGPLGTTGLPGDTGFMGPTGWQGETGAQGLGVTGLIGPTGIQGLTGLFYYPTVVRNFNSSAGVTPSANQLQLDNLNPSAATQITINKSDSFNDGAKYYNSIAVNGYLKLSDADNGSYFNFYQVTNKSDASPSYYVIIVTHINEIAGYQTTNTNYASGSGTVYLSIVGLPGYPGTTGLQGATGLAGATGWQGLTGPAGKGETGLPGVTGFVGPTGWQGLTGPDGKGETGLPGVTGFQGVTGSVGVQGATGIGVAGATGAQGLLGATGLPGGAGATGTGAVSQLVLYNPLSRYQMVDTSGEEVWCVSSSAVYSELVWTRSGTTLTVYRNGHGHAPGTRVIIRNTNIDYQVGLIAVSNANDFVLSTTNIGGTSGTAGAYSIGFTFAHAGGPTTGGVLTAPAGDHADVQLHTIKIRTGTRASTTYELTVPASAYNGAGANTSLGDCYVPDYTVRADTDSLSAIGATLTTNIGGSYSKFLFGNLGTASLSRIIKANF